MLMDKQDHARAEYCRAFLRNWCRAGSGSTFRVVEGRRRPGLVSEGDQEVVVVGRDWLAANAVPLAYVVGDGRTTG